MPQLSKSELKAYRQRVNYHLKKGVSLKEAQQIAADRLPSSEAENVRPIFGQNSDRTPSEVSQVSAEKVQAPCLPTDLPPSETGRKNLLSDITVQSWVEGLTCFVLIVLATSVLISSSLAVLGYGWQGWVLSLTLEVGILYLTVYRVKDRLPWLGIKSLMLCLMTLSACILHIGSETKFTHDKTLLVSSNTELRNLNQRRQRILDLHDSRPKNHTTKREKDLKNLEVIDREVVRLSHTILSSTSSAVLQSRFWMDLWFRLSLLVLNMVCVHRVTHIVGQTSGFWRDSVNGVKC